MICLLILTFLTNIYLHNCLPIDYDSNKELRVDVQITSTEPIETYGSSNYLRDDKIQIWPNGVMYYTVSALFNKKTKHHIRKTLQFMTNEIGLKTDGTNCITFIKRTDETDFVHYFDENGCWSDVGKQGSIQYISIGYGCAKRGLILHETMHALGFEHELSRIDRENYVKLHLENVPLEERYNFEKVNNPVSGSLVPFDYNSIMLYGSKDFSDNGLDTVVAKNGQNLEAVYNKVSLTYYDIKAIRTLYGCDT